MASQKQKQKQKFLAESFCIFEYLLTQNQTNEGYYPTLLILPEHIEHYKRVKNRGL